MDERNASHNRRSGRWYTFVVFATPTIALLLVILLLPSRHGPEPSRRSHCLSNLKLIGIGLQNYHDQYKCLPPPFQADESGKPLHSWRVLLLPFMQDQALQQLHKQHHFDEPWNGPNNSKLAAQCPNVFRCPSDQSEPGHTSYAAVVGVETVWPPDKRLNMRDIHDGAAHTIAVVESAGSGINWLEPRDVTFDQAARGINSKAKPAIASSHPDGANVLFCIGSVLFLNEDIPLDTLRGLLTRSGNETIEFADD